MEDLTTQIVLVRSMQKEGEGEEWFQGRAGKVGEGGGECCVKKIIAFYYLLLNYFSISTTVSIVSSYQLKVSLWVY